MPNGRLSKDVIAARKPKEVYVNTSGNAASVTLYANAISTTANTELSVVVGIASTTLSQKDTVLQVSAGALRSMTSYVYSYDMVPNEESVKTNTGVAKTFMGINKIPMCRYCSNSCYDCMLQDANAYNTYTDTYGCTINRITGTDGQNSGSNCTFVMVCKDTGRCINQMYGGNEIHNPSIWMRQLPASSHTQHGWFYTGKVVGVLRNCCCACCWARNTMCHGLFGNQYPIKAANVGMGVSSNAVSNAQQLMVNWCCCCGKTSNTTAPIVQFDGCSSTNVNGLGNICNLQFCKMCQCHCRVGYSTFNYYSLDREMQCCCTGMTSGNQCWKNLRPPAFSQTCQCLALIAEGELRSPVWYTFYFCDGQSNGCVLQGDIRTCWSNDSSCGCTCWEPIGMHGLGGGQQEAWYYYDLLNSRYCHPCCNNFMCSCCSWSGFSIMDPFGFAYGMTNCSVSYWAGLHSNDGACWHRYLYTYPDTCYTKRCWGYEPCYFSLMPMVQITPPPSTGAVYHEFPIKYWAWNCMGIENKHATCGCTYVMVRSDDANQCGIFTFDAHDSRISQGPFCGCSNAAWQCCGTMRCPRCYKLCDTYLTGGTTAEPGLKKVANWPTAMDCKCYCSEIQAYCFTCLYRADLCTWTIQIYNHGTFKWDGFQSKDLVNWTKITDPYTEKISDTLSNAVTSDYNCLIADCNCYFGSIDCSGIIDYKLSINQYERTGIVLSDGDRIMVNNNSDIETSFQVWGYEG